MPFMPSSAMAPMSGGASMPPMSGGASMPPMAPMNGGASMSMPSASMPPMSGGASMPPMSGGASSSMPSMPPLSSFGLDSNSLFSLGDGPTDGPTEAPAVNIELTAKVAPVTAAAAPIPSWVPKAGTILTQYPRAPIGTYDINGYKTA